MTDTGFFKLAQEFRSNVENETYFSILDSLHEIAAKHQNNLPYSFCIKSLYGFSKDDVSLVLSKLYSDRKYNCQPIKDDIFCVRE